MENFFKNIKAVFDKIPVKSKFLKDLNLLKNQTGFRYFMQGHHEEPNKKFMAILCQELGYDYTIVPIKRDEEHRTLRDKLCQDFSDDLNVFVQRYSKDEPRSGGNQDQNRSILDEATIAFETEKELLDPSKQLDVSDLF